MTAANCDGCGKWVEVEAVWTATGSSFSRLCAECRPAEPVVEAELWEGDAQQQVDLAERRAAYVGVSLAEVIVDQREKLAPYGLTVDDDGQVRRLDTERTA